MSAATIDIVVTGTTPTPGIDSYVQRRRLDFGAYLYERAKEIARKKKESKNYGKSKPHGTITNIYPPR